MTAEELKEFLSTPMMLFVLMIFASLGSAFKQMAVARRSGNGVTFTSYFVDNWPETLIMIGGNIAAFIGLIFTDTLNPAAAIGFGYMANDTADAFTKQGRSASMGLPKQAGSARTLFLVVLAAMAMSVMLSACQTTPDDVVRTACTAQSEYQVERCVKSVAETYEVYQQRGLELVQDPTTPEEVKALVRKADALATPAILEMLESAKAYMRVRDDLAAGATTEEKLLIASQNAYAYVAIAEERINGLIAALSGKESPGITVEDPVVAAPSAAVTVR